MLRMILFVLVIVVLLFGIEVYAVEEIFDIYFMIGGMKDQQVVNICFDDN